MRLTHIGAALVVVLELAACSRTAMPGLRDAGVEAAPSHDTADANSVPGLADAAPPAIADSGAKATDTGSIAADSVVAVPDTAPPVGDSGIVLPDVAAPVGDVSLPDATVVLPDSARPAPDSGTTTPDPYANHTFRIDPQNPAPTLDPECTQYRETDYIQLTFGSDTATLTALDVRGSAAMSFSATLGPEANKLTYHVTNFLGGGVITFEQDHGVYVAQVILYGSGVPVVQCLRGALTPQP